MLTDEQLNELEALEKAATAGPWLVDMKEPPAVYEDDATGSAIFIAGNPAFKRRSKAQTEANIAFTAAARNVIPDLIAEIRKLREAITLAPHEETCNKSSFSSHLPCDCWKSLL